MKMMELVVMASMTGAGLFGGQNRTVKEATVTVCIDFDPSLPTGTLTLASKMFARVGVRIAWRPRPCPADAITVRLSHNANDNQFTNVLGFAQPYEGSHIVVFADRIQRRQELVHDQGPEVMAHVLVHEITHVLEGICRHSATGVMKDRWDRSDYFEMGRKPLPFAQEDIDLVHDGLKVRQARVATALTAAASAAVAGQ